jgi:hypothetical protein
MQGLMAGEQVLTPQERIVAALHSLNSQQGLQCLDGQLQACEFPTKWREQPDGYYSLNYRNSKNGTLVKFKITTEDKYVVAVFSEEHSKESYRVTLNS